MILQSESRRVWSAQPQQTIAIACLADITMMGGSKGGGKASHVNAACLTPFGPKKIRDVEIGDQISNPDGSVSRVIGTFPQGIKKIYQVAFTDGAVTHVTGDHLWLARLSARSLKAERRYFPFHEESHVSGRLFTTDMLRSHLARWVGKNRDPHGNGAPSILVPLTEPVEFTLSQYQLPIVDPYLLGVLLGDGCLRNREIGLSSADEQIIGEVERRSGCRVVRDPVRGRDCHLRRSLELRGRLERLKVYGHLAQTKFVPACYLLAPVHVRRELLQGLMDTDGYADSRGHVVFTSVSKQLAKDVQWIARSLGFRATLTSGAAGYRNDEGEYIQCRDAHDVYIQGKGLRDLFKLTRKRDRCHDNFNGRGNGATTPMRRIVSIEEVGEDEAKCIKVDHPNGLYLTDDFIVTHNSDTGLIFCAKDWDKPGYRAIFFRKTYRDLELHVIPRSKEIFSGVGKYDEKNHRWKFRCPGGGESHLYFGYIQYEGDVFNYSGTQFARMFFDESNYFSERSIRFMVGSLRSAVEGVRPQIGLGANPIGPGFGWHKRMFVERIGLRGERINLEPYQIYKDATWPSDNKPVYDPVSNWGTTCFIPMRVWDNKILLKNDPGYPGRLRTQHGKLTEALLDGSWDVGMNLAVDFEPQIHTVEYGEGEGKITIPEYALQWIGIDWGKGTTKQNVNRASATWMAADDKRIYAYRGHSAKDQNITPFAHEVARRSVDSKGKREDILCVLLSHECFADKGMGQTQADQFQKVFSEYNIPVINSGRDPRGRLTLLKEVLRTEPLDAMQQAGELDFNYWEEQFRLRGEKATEDYLRLTQGKGKELLPKMLIFRPSPDGIYGCPDLIRNLPLLTVDIEDPFVLAEGQEDDDFDSATYALKGYMGPAQRPVMDLYHERLARLGQMPDNPIAAELAIKQAVKDVDEQSEFKPVVLKPVRASRD